MMHIRCFELVCMLRVGLHRHVYFELRTTSPFSPLFSSCCYAVLTLLYTILFFILAAITSFILSLERDGCVNVEPLILHNSDEDIRPLLRYDM